MSKSCRANNPATCPYHGNPFNKGYDVLASEASRNEQDVNLYLDKTVAKAYGWSDDDVDNAKKNMPAFKLRENYSFYGDNAVKKAEAQLEKAQAENSRRAQLIEEFDNGNTSIEDPRKSYPLYDLRESTEYFAAVKIYETLRNDSAAAIKASLTDENNVISKLQNKKKQKQVVEQQVWAFKKMITDYESALPQTKFGSPEHEHHKALIVASRAILIDLLAYDRKLK